MTTTLLDYHAQSVVPCRQCAANPALASHLTYEKLPPFVGKAYRGVLILGHSPKVRTGSQIDTTLDLNTNRALKRYIVGEVLTPLGVELEWCAAVNIVRCLTHEMPEDKDIDGVNLMDAAFVYCQSHLRQEVRTFQPRLVISLSERVSDLLQTAFTPAHPVEPMRTIFGTLRSLTVGDLLFNWIPAVHIPGPNPNVRAHYFPEQNRRLSALKDKAQELLA